MQKLDTLILSGGSIKGFLTLGALQYIYDHFDVTTLNTYIGSSCGSIIVYLLIIGYSPIEIMVYICTHDIFQKMAASTDIVSALNGNGAITFNFIHELLEQMTIDKIGHLLTLKELFNTFKKKLICITYNITKDQTEYISYETHPDLPCITCLRMSSNLPLIFSQFKYDGCYYIDGGITDNLGIKCLTSYSKYSIALNIIDNVEYQFGGNMMDYIYHILSIPIRQLTKNTVQIYGDNCKIINLYDKNKSKVYDFNIKQEHKFNLFSDGYNMCKIFFTTK